MSTQGIGPSGGPQDYSIGTKKEQVKDAHSEVIQSASKKALDTLSTTHSSASIEHKVSVGLSEEWERGPETDKVSGHMWECIGRKKQGEGYLYQFKMRDEFFNNPKKIKAKQDEIFPAEELTMSFEFPEAKSILQMLGGKCVRTANSIILELPDPALVSSKVKHIAPRIEFSIYQIDGIASHEDFIKAFCKNDVVWSTGIEFIHDFVGHLLPTLNRMFQSPRKFLSERRMYIGIISRGFNGLNLAKNQDLINRACSEEERLLIEKHLEKAALSLGLVVDAISSVPFNDPQINTNPFELMSSIWSKNNNTIQDAFIEKNFPETADPKVREEVIKTIAILEKLEQFERQ